LAVKKPKLYNYILIYGILASNVEDVNTQEVPLAEILNQLPYTTDYASTEIQLKLVIDTGTNFVSSQPYIDRHISHSATSK
jgi:hypothetical protein